MKKLNIKKSSDNKEKRQKNSKSETKKIRERSRERIISENNNKIKINEIDDSNSKESISIYKYISQNNDDLKNEKITLEEYISKNDVDQEKIYLMLEKLLNTDKNAFYNLYSKEQFKLTYENRSKLQKKFNNYKDIPESILKNIINYEIKTIFINILTNITEKIHLNVDDIKNIFINNKVYFEKEIDFKVPNKYGSKELKYYSLLSDVYYYFINKPEINLEEKSTVFMYLSPLIEKMNYLNEEELISCSNLLINILYMFLDNETINDSLFTKIVSSCFPFDINIANKTLASITKYPVMKINGELININNCNLKDGNEIITFEKIKVKKKFEIAAKNINWYLGNELPAIFNSDLFMLCVRYPYNNNFNYFCMDTNIKNSVDSFFNLIISSPPMKQAMLIDSESSKYKYFLENKEILKEMEDNVHYVILPFENYYGFTDKKSMDIYINVFIKYDSNFILTLCKFELFFISKAHEFKHASRIYLRLYNNKTKIKTPEMNIKNFNGKMAYLKKIFYNSKKKLIDATINCSQNSQEFNEKFSEYGDLLEISLFGHKLNKLFLKTIIFCLTESSWELSPTEFYYNYSCNMEKTKSEKLEDLCRENFLKQLYEYFNFQQRDKYYNNLVISKSSNYNKNLDYQIISIERKSHEGFKKNLNKKTNGEESENEDDIDNNNIYEEE